MTDHNTLPPIDYTVVSAYCDKNRVSYNEACAMVRAALEGAAQPEPLTDSYVQVVPDKCDRIVWRNHYYHLPIAAPQPAQPVLDFDCVCGASWEHRNGQWEMVDTPHPPQPAATVPVLEPLTEAEIDEEWFYSDGAKLTTLQRARNFARAIEAAHAAKLAKLNGITPPDHFPEAGNMAPAWVPVTKELFFDQAPWLYEPMWIAMNDGRVLVGTYEWQQGRCPDRFSTDAGDFWAFKAAYVMPQEKPAHPGNGITPPAEGGV